MKDIHIRESDLVHERNYGDRSEQKMLYRERLEQKMLPIFLKLAPKMYTMGN